MMNYSKKTIITALSCMHIMLHIVSHLNSTCNKFNDWHIDEIQYKTIENEQTITNDKAVE